MQDEISWNDNTYYEIYNPYSDISPLEPCDAPKMRKYRPKDDRCTNKQIAKRRKRNKNRKTHGGYGFIAPICRDILKKEIVDKISIEVNVKEK